MRDIDFEELDKAVNRFLGLKNRKSEPSSKRPSREEATIESGSIESVGDHTNGQANTADVPTVLQSRNASDFHQKAKAAPRGRFMDIVPASQAIATAAIDRPLKYTAKAITPANTASSTLSKSEASKVDSIQPQLNDLADVKDNLKPQMSSNFNLDVVDYQEPVLEAIDSLDEMNSKSEVVENQANSNLGRGNDLPSQEQIYERSIEVAPRQVKPFEREISLSSGRVGVFPISEDQPLKTFGSEEKIEKVLPEIESKLSKNHVDTFGFAELKHDSTDGGQSFTKTIKVPQISAENNLLGDSKLSDRQVQPENPRIEKEKTLGVDDLTPTNPFLPNARIEKRPLGSPRSGSDLNNSIESKIVGQSHSKTQKDNDSAARTPILASDDYVAPIKPKKKSGWVAVLAILLIIVACGVGLGLLAFFFTM